MCKKTINKSFSFSLLVATLVHAELASCRAMAPASIHEKLKMLGAFSVCDSPFLFILWSAGSDSSLDGVSKTQSYAPFLLSITFAHKSQYLSIRAMPLPTSKSASFVAGWPQCLHGLGLLAKS
jgi:hypothetical protein